MKNNVFDDYEIHKDTFLLIPAYNTDYDTLVIERNTQVHVKRTPIQLIKAACLEGGADYDGRRMAVIHLTGAKHKVPIPVDPSQNIYTFPSHSANQHKCAWIFYHHVKQIKPDKNKPLHSVVTFKNDTNITIDVSYHVLKRQMHRTSYCIVRFSK